MFELKIVWVDTDLFYYSTLFIETIVIDSIMNAIACVENKILYIMLHTDSSSNQLTELTNIFPSCQLSEKIIGAAGPYYEIKITDSSEILHFMLKYA